MLLICLAVATVTGRHALVFISGVTIFFIWQYHVFKDLLLWLRRRKEYPSLSQSGIVDDICREIDYLQRRQEQRKSKLSGYLKQFQYTTAALPDAVIVLDRYDGITWANKKAGEYMGIRWPNDSGLRIANLVRHPRLQNYLSSRDERELNEGLQLESPVNPNLKLECRITSFGDTQKLMVVRDITAIDRINRMRKDFIANASHELRTPLTVISGYLEDFAHDTRRCPQEWQPYIERMRKQAGSMQRLIEDLLLLSTLENRSSETGEEIVPVPDLLEHIQQEAISLNNGAARVIDLDADPSLWFKGSQRDLYSAFSNLVFNAVQHTPARSVIHIRWYQSEQGAHLEVADNGSGIAAEHIPRLTERFYRVDKGRSRESGGTGLGLAIVKHVVTGYGGNLHIESKLNYGTMFRCNFPGSNLVMNKGQVDEEPGHP